MKIYRRMALSLVIVAALAGCQAAAIGPNPTSPAPSATAPHRAEPQIGRIAIVSDESYADWFLNNPYSQLSSYMKESYKADKELYNYLFKAALNREEYADLSKFNLTPRQIMDTASSLYEQAGLHLYYVSYIKWSKDYTKILFEYNDQEPNIAEVQTHFYEQMNHLLHNVAPGHYNDYQRFFAIYDYISKYADYSDDMSDPSTFTAHSVLSKRMGICGGFAILADLAFNYAGIRSEYISNAAHAWNIVELEGERYHADVTWGAGYRGGMPSVIRHALMNDGKRFEGLAQMGLNDEPAIVGYPRHNPKPPAPVTGSRYDFLEEVYGSYALDIDRGWLYFSGDNGIERIRLDGSGREQVWAAQANQLAYFEDTLYFASIGSGEIYALNDGGEPVLLDNSTPIDELSVQDGVLYYGDTNGNGKRLDMNAFSLSGFSASDAVEESLVRQAGHTFSIVIPFDIAMNKGVLPRGKIGLVTPEGKSLPLHMFWSEDGKSLTVRSKSTEAFDSGLKLYIAEGIASASGETTTANRIIRFEND